MLVYGCYLFEGLINMFRNPGKSQSLYMSDWEFNSLSQECEVTPLSDCTVDRSGRLCSILEKNKRRATVLWHFSTHATSMNTNSFLCINHSQVTGQYAWIVMAPVSPAGTCTPPETRWYGLGRKCWVCIWQGRWVLGQPGGFPAAGPAGTGSETAQCTPRPGCL